MSLTLITPYDDAANFVFDAAKIEILGAAAQLKLGFFPIADISEDFLTDAGFTYDSTKTEFVGGVLQQKSQRPTDAVIGVTYTSSIDSSWPILTAGLVGSPILAGGKLTCLAAQGVTYDDASIGTVSSVGTLKVRYTPNYTGSPPQNVNIFALTNPSSANDRILVSHSPSGNTLRITANNSSGTSIYTSIAIGTAWTPTSGTTYEIELGFDATTGTFRIFIDGILHGTLTAGAFSRGTSATIFSIGASVSLYNYAQASFEDAVLFSSVQHTATYTPGYILPEVEYAESTVTFPAHTYSGPGLLQLSDTIPTVTEFGNVRYIFEGLYWNGSAWVSSDGTYAQAISLATFITNQGTFPNTPTSSIIIQVSFPDSSSLSSIDQFDMATEGEFYPVDNPSIALNTFLNADGLDSFIATVLAIGADTLQYLIETRTTPGGASSYTYWNGTAWVASDGTYAQSNTLADIQSNITTLDISSGIFLRFNVLLHSDDGSTTPAISLTELAYNFHIVEPEPKKVIVYGWLKEPDGTPLQGTVTIANLTAFEHTGLFIPKSEVAASTDVNGYWEIEVYETTTINKQYQARVEYTEPTAKTVKFNIIVPNQDSVNLTDMIVA